jgi:uncharacterized protein (TIGR03083 family)
MGDPESAIMELEMVPARSVDCGEIYELKRRELVELLRSLRTAELTLTVPATPEWSVRDVLSHVVGIAADLNARNFGDGDADQWTAAQVVSRRNDTVADLADEWDREAPTFELGLRVLGYEIGSHYVADLLQHAGDVRHALRLPRLADDEALAVALDFYLIAFEEALERAGLGAVEISVGPEHWILGTGETVASVTADRYEAFRSLGGRRSEAQIRALPWRGDLDTILPVVSRYPLPEALIIEASLS